MKFKYFLCENYIKYNIYKYFLNYKIGNKDNLCYKYVNIYFCIFKIMKYISCEESV